MYKVASREDHLIDCGTSICTVAKAKHEQGKTCRRAVILGPVRRVRHDACSLEGIIEKQILYSRYPGIEHS